MRPTRAFRVLSRLLPVFALVIIIGPALLSAQSTPAASSAGVTTADYARAVTFLPAAANPLVVGGVVRPQWVDGADRFTYRSTTADGPRFFVVDAAARTRALAFDHVKLATALATASGRQVDAAALPFQAIVLAADGKALSFDFADKRWTCGVAGNSCAEAAATTGRPGTRTTPQGQPPAVVSPDGTREVFIRDWNLWVRDVASGAEKALTTDGETNFGYATDNAGWRSSARPVVLWSPDSKKVATFQQDERQVGDMYLVTTTTGHPTLKSWKYPLPGDVHVAMLHRVVIDTTSGAVTRFQMTPDFHRAAEGDDFSLADMHWSPDSTRLAFISSARDHKWATLRVADVPTGAVRSVFTETVSTHYENRDTWQPLWATNEVIWYSQRDDWGHLYLYDLATGQLKNQITKGEGPVSALLHVDEKARTVTFAALGREPGQNPYFQHAYRVRLDGTGYAALTPEDGHHTVQVSPSGRFLIDTYSTPERPPVAVLRAADGRVALPIEHADISKLLAIGWKPPLTFSVKGRDGKTDVYGQLFRPSTFDPTKKYPIINNAYPGPQSGSVDTWGFVAAHGDRQALAELGFVVVSIDGMGTPGRSKSFHDTYYGAMGRDNTLPDQVSGIKQLGARYPWIDLDRAAIWGHSGGGFIAADAMFRYPDFFKVGISESGNHDQRAYEDDWGERYQGLLVKQADGTDNYDAEANQTVAKNLKGKLLLAHGLMDNNVPPYNTFLVMDALIKANKDFDLILFPHQAHGYAADGPYMMRLRWDYFVRWLLGVEPPKEFAMPAARPPAR